jgi:ABC-2 type transport system ATP-binding protein
VPGIDALPVHALTVRFRNRAVLDGLSLSAGRGTLTAVLGPNGAGKTTLLRCCTGILTPDSGTVTVLGAPAASRAVAARVGLMPQSTGAWSGIRPAELLRYLAALYAHPQDPRQLMARLRIDAYAETPYRRLSGGEQQAVNLAGALIGRPELVFLDEPTAGMDTEARHTTWRLVEELRADGVSVLLTTHLLDEAERLADKVAIIDSGRVIACDTPQRLADTTRDQDSIRFDAAAGLDLTALSIAVAPAKASEPVAGSYHVTGEITPDTLAATTAWCASLGIMPRNLQIEQRSLEDVFLDLTGRELR